MPKKMTKAQARKRLYECRSKLHNLLAADMISIDHWTKCQVALSKALKSKKLE